jgi:GNAT superfamily N-acetyltransferase
MPDRPNAPRLRIDPATPDDVPLMLELIRELAEYEKEPDAVKTTPQQLHDALFGERPAAEAVIARLDGHPAGWALWFQSYSTWTGLPGLWLEDLFVRPEFRRRGIARALLAYLARVCVDRGYGRLEWSVLDWNAIALDFYRGIGSEAMSEWTTHRLTDGAMRRLASEEDG